MTDVWQALKERALIEGVEESPEGKAFAYFFGMVEGFGKDLYTEELSLRIVSEELAMLLHDALDYFEAQRDE